MLKNLSYTKKLSIVIIGLYLALAILGKFVMAYSPFDMSFEALLRPSPIHLLGTDEMGRDLFSMLINGFRVTVSVSVISAFCSTVIGSVLAVICVYYKGLVDEILVYAANFFVIVPEIIIIVSVSIFVSPRMYNTIIAIVTFSWPKVFKMMRAKLLYYMGKSKVSYTLLLKGSMLDILAKLRYDLYPVVVTNFILQCNKAVMYETTLAFLGVGDPLAKTWGKMIKSAMNYENLFYDDVFWWYLMPPVACVFVFILSLSLLTKEEG